MTQYCYVILNNAGHSWPVHTPAVAAFAEEEALPEQPAPILPRLLQEGWVPIRETPMGGGTSPLAHSLILLERAAKGRPGRPAKR